jgi:hypothetical protein
MLTYLGCIHVRCVLYMYLPRLDKIRASNMELTNTQPER